ncbi:ATP-binding cassette, sub-B (MDR TAP), member 8 [Gonapodya sp. JEL0774]|nr:ATP-binding cassette, sub-B (MDR TAP), member 8 [Gonapodya sp. JEL0774]
MLPTRLSSSSRLTPTLVRSRSTLSLLSPPSCLPHSPARFLHHHTRPVLSVHVPCTSTASALPWAVTGSGVGLGARGSLPPRSYWHHTLSLSRAHVHAPGAGLHPSAAAAPSLVHLHLLFLRHSHSHSAPSPPPHPSPSPFPSIPLSLLLPSALLAILLALSSLPDGSPLSPRVPTAHSDGLPPRPVPRVPPDDTSATPDHHPPSSANSPSPSPSPPARDPSVAVEEQKELEEADRVAGGRAWLVANRVGEMVAEEWGLVVAVLTVTLALSLVSTATPAATGALVTAVQTSLSTSPPTVIPPAPAPAPDSAPLSALLRRASDLVRGFGVGVGAGLLTFLDIALVSRLGERVATTMRNRLYGSVVRQDMAFFDARMGGEVVGRLTDDVSEFKHTFKLLLTQLLKSVLSLLLTTRTLLLLSPPLCLRLLSFTPFLYLGLSRYGAYLRHLSAVAKECEAQVAGTAGEVIGNVRTVRAFGAEGREVERFEEKSLRASRANQILGFHIGLFQGLTNATLGGLVLAILYWGGQMVAGGEMSGGELMQFLLATQTAQRSLSTTGVLFSQSLRSFSAAHRVFAYTELRPKIPTQGGATIDEAEFMGELELRNVSFAYPTRPRHVVLQHVNLKMPQGKVIALCGQSGSIDQNPVLFATSVFENIRYGKPNATLEEVRWAATQANADDFISSWPDGYNTEVGEKGVTVSGGQKQRIAIARALLKNPKILILDEATSALDAHSEKQVQEALDKLMEGRTVLVVAHRLSTIEGADQIVVMSGIGKETRPDGNVVEVGTHAELIQKRGAYYELYNRLYSMEEQDAKMRAEADILRWQEDASEHAFTSMFGEHR